MGGSIAQIGRPTGSEFAPLEWRQTKANTVGGSIHIQYSVTYSSTVPRQWPR